MHQYLHIVCQKEDRIVSTCITLIPVIDTSRSACPGRDFGLRACRVHASKDCAAACICSMHFSHPPSPIWSKAKAVGEHITSGRAWRDGIG